MCIYVETVIPLSCTILSSRQTVIPWGRDSVFCVPGQWYNSWYKWINDFIPGYYFSRCNFYLIIATVPATEVNSTDSVTTNETITISIIDAFLSKIGPAKGCNSHLIAKEELKWISSNLTGKATAPHSSTLAWKIPWTEEPGGLQSMGSLWVGHNRATSLSLFTFMHWRRKWQPTPVFLPGESQGLGAWWAALYGVAQSRKRLKWQQQQLQQFKLESRYSISKSNISSIIPFDSAFVELYVPETILQGKVSKILRAKSVCLQNCWFH